MAFEKQICFPLFKFQSKLQIIIAVLFLSSYYNSVQNVSSLLQYVAELFWDVYQHERSTAFSGNKKAMFSSCKSVIWTSRR